MGACCGSADESKKRQRVEPKIDAETDLDDVLKPEKEIEPKKEIENKDEVVKIGLQEYHIIDPTKNFAISCYEAKNDNINISTPILNYNHEPKSINLKEIKDFCQISLNDENIPFNFEYTFPKEGKYNFKFSYKYCLVNSSNMFFGCKNLISLDLTNFNSSYITNMSCMFFGCKNLETLNVSNFNTSNVTYMSNMFSYCSSLKSLDLSSFNTENVTNMGNMFQDCSSLVDLNISNFTSPKLTFLEGIFDGVKKKCKIICNDKKILNEFK